MRTIFSIMILGLVSVGLAQTYIGPDTIGGGFTGRVSAIACHPTDPNTYFAGGADGGIWRTTNGGTSWTAVADAMPTTAIGALAMYGGSIVVAGSGEANYALHSRYGLGIFKSTDGGTTWMQLAAKTFAGRCFSKIVFNPRGNGSILFAGITPAGGFPEKSAAKGHPSKDGPIGVFRSTDGGASWVQLTNGLPNEACTDLVINPRSVNILYAAIGRPFGSASNGIYKSTDGGTSWVKLAGGLPTTTVGRIGLAMSPNDTNRLYALIANEADAGGGGASTKSAYRSDDGGTTWVPLATGNIQSTYGWYQCLALASPASVDAAFFAGLSMVRTLTGAAPFTTITPPHVDIHAGAFDASGRLVVGCDGGVYRSPDNGSTWNSLNNGLGVMQLYAGVSTHLNLQNNVLGGFQDNGTNYKTSASLSWDHELGGDGGWTASNQVSTNVIWGQSQGPANLMRSDNLGGAWSLKSSGISAAQPNAFYTPVEYVPGSGTTLLCGSDRIYKSTNNGDLWTAISPDVTPTALGAIRCIAIHPLNVSRVMVATTDGVIARSIDGGATFTNVVTGNPGWIRVTREIVASPVNANVWYRTVASFGAAQIQRSSDNGTTWASIDGDLPDLPVNTIGIDPRPVTPVLYAGTDAGLYKSVNSGVNWTKMPVIPNVPVIDIRYRAQFGELIIATQGRGVYRLTP